MKKPFFLESAWKAKTRARVRAFLRSPASREIAQRLALGCLVWTVIVGMAGVSPSLLHICFLYGANALFPLVVIGAIVWIVFGALVGPFIGKEGKGRFRAWSVGICLRAAGWLAKKALLSLVYTAFFVLKLAAAPVWPGIVVDLVQTACRKYAAQMRCVVGLPSA